MSYLFDGSNDELSGAFTSTYNSEGITIAAFVKIADHPIATQFALNFGNSNTTNDHSHRLVTVTTDNRWGAQSETVASVGTAGVTVSIDGVWTAIVGVFTADADRDLYVGGTANTGTNGTSLVLNDLLQHIRVGADLNSQSHFVGRIAEVAIWNTALDSTQINAYAGGTAASGVAAANLIGYWPLSAANATQLNEGLDAGGDLTVVDGTFDADHPSISGGGPSVTDVDTDESITGTQANVVITGTAFGATQGAGHVRVFDGALFVSPSIDTWADTSIQFDMSIGTSTGIRYGSRTLRVTDNGGAFSNIGIEVTAPAGVNFVNIVTPANPADRLTSTPDIASGDQVEWSNVVGGTIADVTVYDDGSYSFDEAVTSFDFRVHNQTEGWGSIGTVSITSAEPTFIGPDIPSLNIVVGRDMLGFDASEFFSDDGPLTYDEENAGIWPPGISVSTAGIISGIPTTVDSYTGLRVQATDEDTQTALSNAFTINVLLEDRAGWTVPDKGEAEDVRQSILFQTYLDVLVAGVQGTNAVMYGCKVDQDVGLQVSIGKGAVLQEGTLRTIVAQSYALPDADTSQPRIDLVVVDTAGDLQTRVGTAGDTPKPDMELGDTGLAAVYRPPGATAITESHIVDMRVLRTQGPIIVAKRVTAVTFNNTAAEQTYFSAMIPAGLFTSWRAIRLKAAGTMLLNSGSPTVALKIVYGGTTLFHDVSGAATADADRLVWVVDATLLARTASDQILTGLSALSALGAKTPPTTGIGDAFETTSNVSPIYGTAAVDSNSADRTFELRWTMSVANAANEIVMDYATADLL